jgi:hypothetical protein
MNNTSTSVKTTLITHIFNEEYLLPFWLEHHKKIFDDLIVIDYNSTDKSVEICKIIWPTCNIIKTRNENFGAVNIDKEVMDIENTVNGIKMVLNTTEFLLCEISIKDLFEDNNNITYSVNSITPYSRHTTEIYTVDDLFKKLLNDDVVYHYDRSSRYIHNYPNGDYHVGRHLTNHSSTETNKAHIIWCGFYPMNEKLMKRKLQIQQNIPQSDKDVGAGFQHLYDRNKILYINSEKSYSGKTLKDLNQELYNLLCNYK